MQKSHRINLKITLYNSFL